MISPFTKPGTKVVCVNDSDDLSLCRGKRLNYRVGEVYTVDRIIIHVITGEPVVQLVEVSHRQGFGLRLKRFRYLDLPKCLTDCLTEQPLLVDELTGAATGDDLAAPVAHRRGLAMVPNFTASRRSKGGAEVSSRDFPSLTARASALAFSER
jgi:hypothetical protein